MLTSPTMGCTSTWSRSSRKTEMASSIARPSCGASCADTCRTLWKAPARECSLPSSQQAEEHMPDCRMGSDSGCCAALGAGRHAIDGLQRNSWAARGSLGPPDRARFPLWFQKIDAQGSLRMYLPGVSKKHIRIWPTMRLRAQPQVRGAIRNAAGRVSGLRGAARLPVPGAI